MEDWENKIFANPIQLSVVCIFKWILAVGFTGFSCDFYLEWLYRKYKISLLRSQNHCAVFYNQQC